MNTNKGWVIRKFAICLGTLFLIASTSELSAFALLGPVQPWMQETNGAIEPGDIGGPMCISNEYRWNVPVVTYGFDQSFLNFFGSNGVAAVEGAIQVLNDLPPASSTVLTDYPFSAKRINNQAAIQSLYDLKSTTLSLLLAEMGLAQPTRYVFVIKQWNPIFLTDGAELDWPAGTIPEYIVQRNYDPQTLEPTNYVDDTSFTGAVTIGDDQNYVLVFPVDPMASDDPSVADFDLQQGGFYTGLTYDDVGGLAYLLSTNNVNSEMLLRGVAGVGANSNSFVNGAWRPGIDKITFMPQPVDPQSGVFLSATNYFTDRFITNGILNQQQVARVILQPDFVFSAGDLTLSIPAIPFYLNTGTTNWLNNAVANGSTNGAGPGVIQPQIQIVFNKLGRSLTSTSDEIVADSSQYWASFDGSANAPVVYPVSQTGVNAMTVRMWLVGTIQDSFVWNPSGLPGAQFAMETSTNLMNWTTLFTVTNTGGVCTYFNEKPAAANRFYRLVSQ